MRLLEEDELAPGGEAWAQLWLEEPVAVVRGDHFVLRSADATLGGGTVVDVDVKRHRRRRVPLFERLSRLAEGSPTSQLVSALEDQEPGSVGALARRANVSEAEALALAREAVAEGSAVALGGGGVTAGTQLYTAAGWGGCAATRARRSARSTGSTRCARG